MMRGLTWAALPAALAELCVSAYPIAPATPNSLAFAARRGTGGVQIFKE
jgi:hypothetical protein